MKIYTSKKDAVKAATTMDEIFFDNRPFCPTINGLCNTNCICHATSMVLRYKNSNTEVYIRPPYCIHKDHQE